MEIKAGRGLIREGFGRRGQSQWAWTEGRDDRWRLSGGCGGERHGRGCAWGWTIIGVVSGLCQGVRKSCWLGLGLGCGMASAGPEAVC